ncbi:glycosyltransferase family 2 protein [Elizabethkingia meningoseptica]|uniref:glycosyltransferase family 2 protein n=1 Tax=Elizabethkingia meningoseptica TaxID=238 RepID=UPI003015951D
MMKFSLIIPVYQVEKFIGKCIESCLFQDLPKNEYEIIIINDGSKDGSLKIALEFSQKYDNIQIISQENKGLSEARNVGLTIAKGKYIWFIDSDDWIENNCLVEMFNICEEKKLDILHFNSTDYKNSFGIIRRKNEKYYNRLLLGKEYILDTDYIDFPVCFNIYRKSFLTKNKLYFKKDIFHEDNEFSPRAFYYANSVFFLESSYYNVYHNPVSITRTNNPKKSFDLIQIILIMSVFIDQSIREDDIKSKFYNYMGLAFNGAVSNILFASHEDRKKFVIEIMKNKKIISRIFKSKIFKYKLQILIFNINLSLYLNAYSFLKYKRVIKW